MVPISEVTDAQATLLQLVYDVFRESGAWPTFGAIDRRLYQEHDLDAEALLQSVPSDLIRGVPGLSKQVADNWEVALTLGGISQCRGVAPDLENCLQTVKLMADRERSWSSDAGGEPALTADELPTALGPVFRDGPGAAARVGALLYGEPIGWTSFGRPTPDGAWDGWTIHFNRTIRRFKDVRDFDDYWQRRTTDRFPQPPAAEQPSLPASKEQATSDYKYEYDVAVSFAGDDREYVEGFVKELQAAGIKVFYDADNLADSWGQDQVEYFTDVFTRRARFAVMFISAAYGRKMWPRQERKAVLARAAEQEETYLLPVRLDDTVLPGLLPTVGYLDARTVGLGGLVRHTLQKLTGSAAALDAGIDRVPRTEVERQRLLLERPASWEYLYFAAEILHLRQLLEPKFLDYDIRFSESQPESFDEQSVHAFMQASIGEVQRLAHMMGAIYHPAVQERAFGRPGEAGDPIRLQHLAKRWTSIYEGFIDWSAKVRGAVVPAAYRRAIDLLSAFADDPILKYREFTDQLVEQCDRIPAATVEDPIYIELEYTLKLTDGVQEAYSEELDVLLRRLEEEL